MTEHLARFLTTAISQYYSNHNPDCLSSYECELIEKKFIEGKFEEIEKYVRKRIFKIILKGDEQQ